MNNPHTRRSGGVNISPQDSEASVFWGKNSRALGAVAVSMTCMPDAYDSLLEATIQHLQVLKARGVRYLAVSPGVLEALARPGRRAGGLHPGFANPRLAPADAVGQTPVSSLSGNANLPGKLALDPASTKESGGARQKATPPLPGSGALAATADGSVLDPEAKASAFARLRERVLACRTCSHLASSRKNVVFGVGDINAELMFVGEAPGADEDEQAEPFVGKAGQLLTRIIQTMGLSRGDVFIANILKCRPDTPGQASGNRKPTAEEMQTCIPYLHEQIDLIKPKVIVALGATAVEGLLGKTIGITRLRGQWRSYRGIALMPTYHPAYLLRNQALSEKRRVWEDMLQVMERLGLLISDKQRNYFL